MSLTFQFCTNGTHSRSMWFWCVLVGPTYLSLLLCQDTTAELWSWTIKRQETLSLVAAKHHWAFHCIISNCIGLVGYENLRDLSLCVTWRRILYMRLRDNLGDRSFLQITAFRIVAKLQVISLYQGQIKVCYWAGWYFKTHHLSVGGKSV